MGIFTVHTENGKKVLTMAEYIEREAAIDAVTEVYYNTPDVNLSGEKFEAAINGILAADVAPVRHGRWVEKEKYTFGIMYDCSLCEDRILDNGHPWNYCPNCGAKMDGGDTDAAD